MMQPSSFAMDAYRNDVGPITSTDTSHLAREGCTLTQMRLCDLRIDPQQPRQYLPADLRAQAAKGLLSPVEVLAELQARAGAGDLEAVQYAGDIEALAESLRLDGLIYPLKVESLTLPNGRAGGHIVDGERRYWASVWCSMKSDAVDFAQTTIDVLMLHLERDGAALEHLQWAANIQRRDMPVMIMAEAAARMLNELESALQVNRIDTLARYGLNNLKKGKDRMLLVKLTAIEMHRRTGKSVSERMLYRLLMFVNRLTTEARRLAIAANLDYRALETVAAAEPAQQIGVIRCLVNGLPSVSASSCLTGVDPAITHAMQLFETLKQVADHDSRVWLALHKADDETRRDYLSAMQETLSALMQQMNAVELLMRQTASK
jgi:hypothetical protein